MADNGIWFKLHCSADDDPDLDNLDIADFGRWAKLGIQIKRHGTEGTIVICPPARTLCAKFQVVDFDALIAVFSRMPHVSVRRDNSTVSSETNAVVSFHNWLKYQGDFSSGRVRKFRKMKRSRGEERRGEEKRGEEIQEEAVPASGQPSLFEGISIKDFVESWNENFKGSLPSVDWPISETRKRKIAARLREHSSTEFWSTVFTNIGTSSFLLGNAHNKGHEAWQCTLDFLVANDTNCVKIFEGAYNHAKNRA